MRVVDVAIAGAGVIGLSLALELRSRGASVLLLESDAAGGATPAAAGMLAVNDATNPPQLRPLAELSSSLYPSFLDRLSAASTHVPFETEWVVDLSHTGHAGPFASLAGAAQQLAPQAERSVDPRRLLASLRHAMRGEVHTGSAVETSGVREDATSVTVQMQNGEALTAGSFVDCTGAWSAPHVLPSKGQMLRLRAPDALFAVSGKGNVTLRSHHIYLVPRLDGSVLAGATVEDAGFDLTLSEHAMDDLHRRAARLLPALAGVQQLERWAGLRPRTADDLPVLGRTGERTFVASGHFRNGMLLAPATAVCMANQIAGGASPVDLSPFDPARAALRTQPVLAPA